jgi:Cys-rich repeat protein
MYTDAGCRIGCDKCGPNSFCVSAPYNVACVQKCTNDSQCSSGFLCALINGFPTAETGCVSPDRPVWCSMEPCNIQAKCRDANTLLRPLPFSDAVCGWEIVPCVSGCDATTAQCK